MPSLAAAPGSPPATSAWWLALASPVVGPAERSGRRWLAVALCVWVAATLLLLPMGIGTSWRECDTQAIARNFLVDGFDPLRPRIDWRGDTDGAVECEFPLYQTMIASVMALLGEAEWPGRVISLLAMVMATLSLHRLLEARSGPAGALVGAFVFLTGGHAFLLGGRVTPDATSLALAIAGLVAFVQFLGSGRTRTLVLATAMTTVACLTKPTALQVGLLQFLWTLCLARHRLREGRVWLAWAVVLGVVAAWVVHGVRIYDETGLTFGVAAGGETKFPTLRSLREKWIWFWLAVTTLRYGFSGFGIAAALVLLFRRRLDRADLALLTVAGLGLVGTLRYSHHFGIGPQYHAFAAVAGAFLAARAWPLLPPRLLRPLLAVALFAAGAWHLSEERAFRVECVQPANLEAAHAAAAMCTPAELAVVHSVREQVDPFWRRRTNYEEPILLYHARRRGWVLPRDGFTVVALADLHRRGARLVVDQMPDDTPADARQWLETNSEQVRESGGRRLYRLRAST